MEIYKDGKMVFNTKKRQAIYGHSIGIIMLDCLFPRMPGDIGNASTFDFPVLYRVVREVAHQKIVDERDERFLEPFISAARELEMEGVKAITTSCGFLSVFQQKLAQAVTVPFFASSLMQVPLVYQMLGKRGKVGILAAEANTRRLSDDHFTEVGWSMKDIPIAVATIEECEEFKRGLFLEGEGPPDMNVSKIEEEITEVIRKLLRDEPEVRALVIECTNIAPFTNAIQIATGLPIFDIITLTKMVHDACVRSTYYGIM